MFLWRVAGGVGVAGLALAMLVVAYLTVALSPAPIGLLVPIGLAAAFAFTFLAFARPYVAILITFFVIPFEYLTVLFPAESYGAGGPLNFITLVKLMFGAVIVAGFLRLAVTKDDRPLRNLWLTAIPLLLLLFYGMCWMSLANAKRLGAFANNMMSIGSGVVAFFILINLLTTRQRLYRFLKVLFFSYIFIALIGLFEAVTRTHVLKLAGRPMIERPWTQNPDAFRVAGPSGDPDYYAISVIFGLMVTFAVLPLFKSVLARLAVLGITLLHFLAIVGTASRGAALSTALALGLFYALARFRHKLAVGVLAVVTLSAGFALFTLTVSSRAAQRYVGADTSSWDERWGWIKMCYFMMLDAPVRGVGSGQFTVLYDDYKKTYPVPRQPEYAQNTYAQLAAQNGIPTTLVYLAANFVLWSLLYRVMRGTRDPTLEHVAVSFFALALSFWFFSLTLDLVETEISWVIFAAGVVLWRLYRQEHEEGTLPDGAGARAVVRTPARASGMAG